MKKRLILTSLVITVIIVFSLTSLAQPEPSKEQALSHLLMQSLESWHFSPRKINDEFSERAFKLYLNSIDRSKRFLTKSDIEQLKSYDHKIDDELKGASTDFLELSEDFLSKRIQEVQAFSQEILKKPFDFSVEETLETDSEKRDYADGSSELKELWRKILKYQTLMRYLDLVRTEDKDHKTKAPEKSVSLVKQPFQPKLELQAREGLSKNLKRDFQRMLEDTNKDLDYDYNNAITGSFDPHSEYFPPDLKDEFDIDMSGTLEGIGALLQEDGEYVKIQEIVPGSPSWRQKEPKAGDIILKVAEGNAEPVDIVNMRVTDAVKLIRGKKGTEVRLTIRKPNGQIVVIPIIRDVVVIEETFAKSAVITNKKTGRKFGYLILPAFYRDFKTNGAARNCSDDVRKELEKLKDEKVDGIIFDLRNNGGGALEDAVKISGFFIKNGPIVQVKNREAKGEVWRDVDPEVVYSGPLVVLLNSFSASASEIMAAALQDYNRAVIIGSPNTFGKGTVQTFVNLDQIISDKFNFLKPLGSLKLTIQKFYRINGESTQSKGVIADITLPDSNSYLQVGEKTLDYPLPWDTMDAVSYKKWESQKYDFVFLKQKSTRRVQASKGFKLINDTIARIKKEKENSLQTLKLSSFLEEQETLRQESEKLKNAQTELPNLKLATPGNPIDPKRDPEKAQKAKDWLKQLGMDVYVGEAQNILSDTLGQ